MPNLPVYVYAVGVGVGALAVGLVLGYFLFKKFFEKRGTDAETIVKRAEGEAQRLRETAEKAARDAIDKMRRDAENELREKRRRYSGPGGGV